MIVTFTVKGTYRTRQAEWPLKYEVQSDADLAAAQAKVDVFRQQLESEGWVDITVRHGRSGPKRKLNF